VISLVAGATVLSGLFLLIQDSGAVPITIFSDVATYAERAEEIVIARCLTVPEDGGLSANDGFYPATVDVITALKGPRRPGELKIATIFPMKTGQNYLLANTGGKAFGTDFLALGELTIVPVPESFDLASLENQPLKEQLEQIFSRQLYEVEREMAPLIEKQRQLQRALKDRTDDLVESLGPIHLPEIKELSSTRMGSNVFLQLPLGRLEWSQSSPGKSGYLYYNSPKRGLPQWEFAAVDERLTEVESLEGTVLKGRFFGPTSPARDKRLGQPFSNAIQVEVGRVVLVRDRRTPERICILEIASQGMDESMTARYVIVEVK
jgi:hypothetical protein